MRSNGSGRRGERGVTLVMMALMLFLALGFSALAVDYGMIKASKAEAQRAVDAAALAGASAFLIADPAIDKVPIAEERAREYARMHTVRTMPITDPQIAVDVDVPNTTVTVTYSGSQMSLWFAQAIGIPTMAVNALAAAHVYETSQAACVMPVAIPDLWKNNDIAGDHGPEELGDPDGLWSYQDWVIAQNGYMDAGTGNTVERELWEFDPGVDVYDATGPNGVGPPDGVGDVGYGSSARNTIVTGNPLLDKQEDYGRQIVLMNISSKDGTVSSNYYAWGFNSNDANSGDVLRDKIAEEDCSIATISTEYPASAGNGATAGAVSPAWDTRIGRDADAYWDDGTNTVVNADGYDDENQDGVPDFHPRVVIVALYNPALEMAAPSDNQIVFNNFAKIWVDQRPPGCSGPSCKAAITGRFLGFVEGVGEGTGTTGSLIKKLQLIR
jgi:Putative Flp pilus-assembly TadE/G-like